MSSAFRKLVENGSVWKICMAGACIPLAASLAKSHIQYKIQQEEYYTEAVRLIKQYRALDDLLGEPWTVWSVNRGITSSTRILKDSVTLDIPVQGRKDKGTVQVHAYKCDDKWIIYKLHINLKKSHKQWTFYENSAAESRP